MERARPISVALAVAAAVAVGCAGAPERRTTEPDRVETRARTAAARTALSMVGVPYRYSGNTPAGFDCSGLVVYSYATAGVSGLPHSAERLERLSRAISLADLEPGDLLFFQLSGKKTSHVGIFVGGRSFVHAPSSGKGVERVSFDHGYWGARLSRAGRLGR